MDFNNYVKNKVTELKVRRGDDVLNITHEYDIENLETLINDFKTILKFFTYIDVDNILKDYYRDEIIDEYLNEVKDDEE